MFAGYHLQCCRYCTWKIVFENGLLYSCGIWSFWIWKAALKVSVQTEALYNNTMFREKLDIFLTYLVTKVFTFPAEIFFSYVQTLQHSSVSPLLNPVNCEVMIWNYGSTLQLLSYILFRQ